MVQPVPWGSLGLAGVAVGAVGQEGVCRTYSAELIPKLAVGPLPAHLCPPDLVLQFWWSLGALKFIMLPHGRLGTTELGGGWVIMSHEMEERHVLDSVGWEGLG